MFVEVECAPLAQRNHVSQPQGEWQRGKGVVGYAVDVVDVVSGAGGLVCSNDNDNDNDTQRSPTSVNEGLALQARVKGS